MNVTNYPLVRTNNISPKQALVFKHNTGINSLNNINIGAAAEGVIGAVKVRNSSGNETFLNVVKKNLGNGYEKYSLQNNDSSVVGEVILTVKKYLNYDSLEYKSDPSHVFVDELKNYSNPKTPYYRDLEYYKDVGTRLLQIALKRSCEAGCDGNLKLISKNESKEWYNSVIGMTEEFPANAKSPYAFNIHNPNTMILPPVAKEHLMNLQGGL